MLHRTPEDSSPAELPFRSGAAARTALLLALFALAVVFALCGCSRGSRGHGGAARPGGGESRSTEEIVGISTTPGVNNLICDRCHGSMADGDRADPGIRFSHAQHLKTGAHCNQCHTSVDHSKDIMPGHPECFGCHDGKKAPKTCRICHERTEDTNPHPPGFLKTHDETALKGQTDCRSCHDESYCLNCHTLAMPHPRGWREVHGGQVGSGDCAKCHTRDYCSGCHKRSVPGSHKDRSWLQIHGERSRLIGNDCALCHGTDSCNSCHAKRRPPSHGRGDWKTVHGDLSLKLDSNCQLCHGTKFCLSCHKTPMPHPGNWTSAHAKTAQRGLGDCRRCHQPGECRTCHERRKIVGHKMPFMVDHAGSAKADKPTCSACHAKEYCATCHSSGVDGRIFPGEK